MPAVWFVLKRSLHCKSERQDVYDPNGTGNRNLTSIVTKKTEGSRSGCSRSIANLKDVVIHGSKRHMEKPPICSPRSIGSSELLNPITHEVILNNSTCELKISAGTGFQADGDDFVGTLKPGTPGPARLYAGARRQRAGILGSPVRRSSSSLSRRSSGLAAIATKPRCSYEADSRGGLFCNKCGEEFVKWDAVEEHHLSKHAGKQIFIEEFVLFR